MMIQLLSFSNLTSTIIPSILRKIMKKVNWEEKERKWEFYKMILQQYDSYGKHSKYSSFWYPLIILFLKDNDPNLETENLWKNYNLDLPSSSDKFYSLTTTMFYKIRNDLIKNNYVKLILKKNEISSEFPSHIKTCKDLLFDCLFILFDQVPLEHHLHFFFPSKDSGSVDLYWFDFLVDKNDHSFLSKFLSFNQSEQVWNIFFRT